MIGSHFVVAVCFEKAYIGKQRSRKQSLGGKSLFLLVFFRIAFFDRRMALRISLAPLWVSAGIIVVRIIIFVLCVVSTLEACYVVYVGIGLERTFTVSNFVCRANGHWSRG